MLRSLARVSVRPTMAIRPVVAVRTVATPVVARRTLAEAAAPAKAKDSSSGIERAFDQPWPFFIVWLCLLMVDCYRYNGGMI